jgi:hypothetical protein
MSDLIPRLPARPSFEQLRKQATDLMRAYRRGEAFAFEKLKGIAHPLLADAQFVLAREHGFASWAKLKRHFLKPEPTLQEQYELLARDLADACRGNQEALKRLHEIYGNDFTQASAPFDLERLRAKVDERLKAIATSPSAASELNIADAQLLIARQHGVATWARLIAQVAPNGARPQPLHSSQEAFRFYTIHSKSGEIVPGPVLSQKTWDVIFDVMKERGITALNAAGRMTDGAMKRLARLDHVTRLNLGGCLQLTDEGLKHLARMPQLRELQIDGWKGKITDHGLGVLQHLRDLRKLEICWQQNVTDAGMAHLAGCDLLEDVNLLGTPSGDGAIEALAGKAYLRQFNTGREVTDTGIERLHLIPAFKTWQGGEIKYELMGAGAGPTRVLIDGPFTDAGLAKMIGLDGLFGLTFFWHSPKFTSSGLASLVELPRLGFLGCQDDHCDDEAMRHIAAMPHLKMLMGQGAVATDEGFAALSRSRTIEYIWGRDCPNFTSKGFEALSKMPALRGLAVSCKNVDDAGLARLSQFPALRELMPMDVPDSGFRHVGECGRLEALWCMYCRDTGDAATEHLKGLANLKTYYAGASQITDRSLEILGRMESLERIEFWQCLGISDAGIAHLAGLPRLREVTLGGLPGVTLEATRLFPARVQLTYS